MEKDGHWTCKYVLKTLLSALNFLLKMNLVHICLLNAKLRLSHVNDVTLVCTICIPYALRSTYGVVYELYTRPSEFYILSVFMTYRVVSHIYCMKPMFMDSFGNRPHQVL